jgi:hypothetical protein
MADEVPVADYYPTHGSHSDGRGTIIGAEPVHGAHSRPPKPTAVESEQMTFFDIEPDGASLVGDSPGEGGGCQHIHLLTPLPSVEEAFVRAKRLQSVPVPWFPAGFFGEHSRLGKFVIDKDDGDHVEWRLVGEEAQACSLQELSFNPSKAPMRLKLGWLISAIHELDGIHIADEIADPAEAMKERSRWDRKAKAYLKWAIAPVEKIISN